MPAPSARYAYKGYALPLKGWSKRLGVPVRTLRARLRAGLPYSKAFSSDDPAGTARRPHRGWDGSFVVRRIRYKGRLLTQSAMARELGLSVGAFLYRVRRDSPLSVVRNGRRRRIELKWETAYYHEGEVLVAEKWAARLGIPTAEFLARVRDGLSADEVFAPAGEKAPAPVATSGCARADEEARRAQDFVDGLVEGVGIVIGAVGLLMGGMPNAETSL